jgi:hypothetical protein
MPLDSYAAGARAHLAALPAGYVRLYDRLVSVVAADDRIRAMWLGGSVARGVADLGSDLDVLLAVRDDALTAFADGWRDWLASLTPILLSRDLPGHPGSFFATTHECLRLDVIVETVSILRQTPYRERLPVLDPDDLTLAVPEPEPAKGPDPDRIAAIVEEFYRQQVIFPAAVVARRDWLLGVVGVQNTHLMLYQLLVATNEPLPPMGIKQWSSRLTPWQRTLLTDLPQPRADRESVTEAMRAVRHVFRTTGRDRVLALGFPWPDDVDARVARYWTANDL